MVAVHRSSARGAEVETCKQKIDAGARSRSPSRDGLLKLRLQSRRAVPWCWNDQSRRFRVARQAPSAMDARMRRSCFAALALFGIQACTTTRTTVVSGDGGSSSAPGEGSRAGAFPSGCNPQPESQTYEHCPHGGAADDGTQLTLVACDPNAGLPPGCSRTTLASSFCCPTPHVVSDPRITELCARWCGVGESPTDCESRTSDRLSDRTCGSAYEAWLTCAVGAGTCDAAPTKCSAEVAAYLDCDAKQEGLDCAVGTDSQQVCRPTTINGVSQGTVFLKCAAAQHPSSWPLAACHAASSSSSPSSGAPQQIFGLCCDATLF